MKFIARVLSSFIDAWVTMLILGSLHSHDARIPAFGYWMTFWLVVLFTGLVCSAVDTAEL